MLQWKASPEPNNYFKVSREESSERKGLPPLTGWQCNTKAQHITGGGKTTKCAWRSKQLVSSEQHTVEGRWDPQTRSGKMKQKPRGGKDSRRSMNQRSPAPAGHSGKKIWQEATHMLPEAKPGLRRKQGRAGGASGPTSPPALRARRGRLSSYSTFSLGGPTFSRGTILKKPIIWTLPILSFNVLWIQELGPWELTWTLCMWKRLLNT